MTTFTATVLHSFHFWYRYWKCSLLCHHSEAQLIPEEKILSWHFTPIYWKSLPFTETSAHLVFSAVSLKNFLRFHFKQRMPADQATNKTSCRGKTCRRPKLSEEKFWADQNIQKTKILSRRKLSADRNWADHQLIEQQTDSAVSNLRGPASVTGLYCLKVARFPKASELENMTSKKVAICSPGSIFKACHVMYYFSRSFISPQTPY